MYKPSEIERVCEALEDESAGLRVLLQRFEMSPGQFFRTLEADPTLAERYVRAKARQAELLADEIVEIADMSGTDLSVDDNGNVRIDGEAINRSRLRMDARKWTAAKLLPKRFGEKLDVTTDGKPITLTDEERAARIDALLDAARARRDGLPALEGQ